MRLHSVTIYAKTLKQIGPAAALDLILRVSLALGPNYKTEKMLNVQATKFTRGNA